jgi:pimeloyl-ACP methyl ester carboxylesterase
VTASALLVAVKLLAPASASPAPAAAGIGADTARQIPVSLGSPPLKGTLTLPAGKGPFAAVVLVSGSGPEDQDETIEANKPFLDIALGLAARGIATLRYDKRTLDYPKSVDPKTFTPAREYVPDAVAAIHLLERQPEIDRHRIFVLGHSQGGTYAPLIAKDSPQVAGVILLAAGTESLGAAALRQVRYLATLPGTIGTQAKAELPEIRQLAAQITDTVMLEKDRPGTILFGGVGAVYYLSELRYNPVATARSIRQPLLLLQGERDYQLTVTNDLDVWLKGLKGRNGVTVVQFPNADHLFLDGSGPPTPLEYATPGHVDPKVIATIASWVANLKSPTAGAKP